MDAHTNTVHDRFDDPPARQWSPGHRRLVQPMRPSGQGLPGALGKGQAPALPNVREPRLFAPMGVDRR